MSDRAEIEADPGRPGEVAADDRDQLAQHDREQEHAPEGHGHLAGFGRVIQGGHEPAITGRLKDSEIIRE